MSAKNVKIKFYSEEEKNYLSSAINSQMKIDQLFLEKASKKLNRTTRSIRQYIYSSRKKVNNPLIKNPSFKQGEFIIPIEKWEIRTLDGVNHLVFKFGKNNK